LTCCQPKVVRLAKQVAKRFRKSQHEARDSCPKVVLIDQKEFVKELAFKKSVVWRTEFTNYIEAFLSWQLSRLKGIFGKTRLTDNVFLWEE